jgi:hypothetical protein
MNSYQKRRIIFFTGLLMALFVLSICASFVYADNWTISTIDSAGVVGEDTSIAIDSNNKIHVSYFDFTNQDLKYATNSSGSWVTSTIDSTGYVGYYTSIAVDSNNKAHISYYNCWPNLHNCQRRRCGRWPRYRRRLK